VSNLTEETLRLEAEAAKERSDAELSQPEDKRNELREKQGLEERILEITNTRRQLMIDAGALSVSHGSKEMLEIAFCVEEQLRQRFGEDAQWRMSADDDEFGVEWHDGQLRVQQRPEEPAS
jgi:hypothetical protein